MLSFFNIWTITKFELKTLMRSWFLRIFSIIIFGILFIYNLLLFTNTFNPFLPRDLYGMSSFIPYVNLLFFNMGAAVIAVFLSADFLKRDQKLDTTEAIYIRSMSNFEYVIGKALALFIIFALLNLIIILMASAFNLFGHSPVYLPLTYLYYYLLLSFPSMIYIIGLSFLLMTLIKNQAIINFKI